MTYTEARHRPFYSLPGFFPSPEKHYILPPYAEALAVDYTSQGYIPTRDMTGTLDPRVLQFLDMVALEVDEKTLCTNSSAHSQSMSSSST